MSSSISPNDTANIVIISESTKKLKEKRQKITQKASFVQYQSRKLFFAPCGDILRSVLRISLLRPKKFSAPSIIWISKGTNCRGRYCRPSRLHLQPPRGNTCRLPEVTRADSGLSKTGCERWGIKYRKVPPKRLEEGLQS